MSSEDAVDENPSKESIEKFRNSIFESFSEVQDPRPLSSAVRYELVHILFMTLCAILCGADKLKEIAVYAKEREEWLTDVLKLPYGVPSYSTFWITLAMLNPDELLVKSTQLMERLFAEQPLKVNQTLLFTW